MTKGKYLYMFTPPGFEPSRLPKWYEYIAMLERTVAEDPESEEAKQELTHSRQRIAKLEARRDEEQAKSARQAA
jgi:hypothetical protein